MIFDVVQVSIKEEGNVTTVLHGELDGIVGWNGVRKGKSNLGDRTTIFTDGSSQGGRVGAAASLFVDSTHVSTLRYHLGSDREHTVFEAEATALILAAHLLATRDEVTYPATILADNQAVILSSERPSSKPGHYLLSHFRAMLRRVLKEEKIPHSNITVRWIAGHKNIAGNEHADKEAKAAAEGRNNSSPKNGLPVKLRSPLPHSVSATKQYYNKKLTTLWTREWKQSPRYRRNTSIMSDLPSKAFLDLAGTLYKKQAGLYIQLRTGHAPLNHHLHRIKKADTPICLQCDHAAVENVHHYLLQCPRYARERHVLHMALGRKATQTAYLLNSPEARTHILRYINTTKRLSMTFGEIPITPPAQ